MNPASPPRRARILEISAFPPPRAGWSVRVEFLKKRLEQEGHECVVLNVGSSRLIPSPHYETVLGGLDYAKKVWRYSRAGFTVHAHVNGDSPKGFVLTLLAQAIGLACGNRPVLTFHAGVEQDFFPRPKAPWLLPMFWLMFAMPRRIVCNTTAVKGKILEYGVPDAKVTPIAAFSRQYLEFTPMPLSDDLEDFYRRHRVLFAYVRVRESFDLLTLVDGFADVARMVPDAGLLLVGITEDHIDAALWERVQDRIRALGIDARIRTVEEFDHDRFRTALSRAALYLRTPTSDGAASSVLEAMALGIPVLAAENGTRPAGVMTYRAGDSKDLSEKVRCALVDRDGIALRMPRPLITDTLSDEVRVLTGV